MVDPPSSMLLVLWSWIFVLVCAESADGGMDDNFSTYIEIIPRVYNGRTKREVRSYRDLLRMEHAPALTLHFDTPQRNYSLQLIQDRDFVSSNAKLRFQRNGSYMIDDLALLGEHCYYTGVVRGRRDSLAVVSTCHGISGVIYDDDDDTMYLTPGGTGRHYLYRGRHMRRGGLKCGVSDADAPLHSTITSHSRVVRDLEERVRGPYNSDQRSRYVELVLVMDQQVFKESGEDLKAVHRRAKLIANVVNKLFSALNVFVALIGVEVWNEKDEIVITDDGDETLTNFLQYRRQTLVTAIPNDNAQLLTGEQFKDGVVGKALKGPICTHQFSGGVNVDHSKTVGLVATTVAHEMGHNFGMEHDASGCVCPEEKCIMAASSSSVTPNHWSDCSREYLALSMDQGMDYCLRNKPESLFESSVCGNGFVEPGEQCDCGLPDTCSTTCCDPDTCMLTLNASCATGACCDLQTCAPRRARTLCRVAEHECDLPEYCNGQGEYCPDNVYKADGTACMGGDSYCYTGKCDTRESQCRLLWGQTGHDADVKCYEQNIKGKSSGNCGYDMLTDSYKRCMNTDALCGTLQCAHLSEKLHFGLGSAAKISSTTFHDGGKHIFCKTAIIDLGLEERDPGLVPNGSPCGHEKMCVEQRCVDVVSVTRGGCESGCAGHGVCNSRGNCHCDYGWGPPDCTGAGYGGSVDSGPPSVHEFGAFVVVMFVFFLGVVPLFALFVCCAYARRHNVMVDDVILSILQCPLTAPLIAAARKLRCLDALCPSRERKASGSAAGGPRLRGADAAASSPLTDAASSPLTDAAPSSPAHLSSGLVGTFSGFSLKPLDAQQRQAAAGSNNPALKSFKPPPPGKPIKRPLPLTTAKPASRPVAVVKPVSKSSDQPAVQRTTFAFTKDRSPARDEKRSTGAAAADSQQPPQGARTTFNMRSHVKSPPQVGPAAGQDRREKTATAVQDRSEKTAPVVRTTFGMAVRASDGRGQQSPTVQTPRTTFQDRAATAAADIGASCSRSATLDSSCSDGVAAGGRQGQFGGAVARMSGFFRRGVAAGAGADNDAQQAPVKNRQSFKATKIDRERLKNMQISAPIAQSVPSLVDTTSFPISAAPSKPTPASQSVRRPTSRPSAPPPCPPPVPHYDDPPVEDASENFYSTADAHGADSTSPDLLTAIAAEMRSKDCGLYATVSVSDEATTAAGRTASAAADGTVRYSRATRPTPGHR